MLITCKLNHKNVEGTFLNIYIDGAFYCNGMLNTAHNYIYENGVYYGVVLRDSPKHGKDSLRIVVPKHPLVLIHQANWPYQLAGCLAVGKLGQDGKSLVHSMDTLKDLKAKLAVEFKANRQPLILFENLPYE